MQDAVSESYCQSVYIDGIKAANEKDHACWPMYEWQKKEKYGQLQLPEPFSGERSRLKLAFVGLNPSISKNEEIPSLSDEWNFERYDQYYRDRFSESNRNEKGRLCVKSREGKLKPVTLWNNIERFGRKYLNEICDSQFSLGDHAILIEAIRYKSTDGWVGGTKEQKENIFKHQADFTTKLIEEGLFSILVPMGNGALSQLRKTLEFEEEIPWQIMKAMGNSYIGHTKSGFKVVVCPIKHMSYPAKREKSADVAKQIVSAFRQSG